MLILEICEKYKWDYYTYLAQPVWFIELIHDRMSIDAKKAKAEQAKMKAGGKH